MTKNEIKITIDLLKNNDKLENKNNVIERIRKIKKEFNELKDYINIDNIYLETLKNSTTLEEFEQGSVKLLNKIITELYTSQKNEESKIKEQKSTIKFNVNADLGVSNIDFLGLESELKNPTGFISILENICKHKDIHTVYIYNWNKELFESNPKFYEFIEDIKDSCEIIYINKK